MHFEFLVEDLSGKIALEHFIKNILEQQFEKHTVRVIEYRGIGKLPANISRDSDPRRRILLDRLPSLLRGYGKTFRGYGQSYRAIVIVVCDLDRRDHPTFMQELTELLHHCDPRPMTLFHIAVEEGEAWLLGDRAAVLEAYPNAKKAVLAAYVQDSICGTWEVMADAIHEGGAAALKAIGYPETGRVKCEWAATIAPFVDANRNVSPSFQRFRDEIREAVYEPE